MIPLTVTVTVNPNLASKSTSSFSIKFKFRSIDRTAVFQLMMASTCNFIRHFFQKARRGLGSCFSVTHSSANADAGRPPTTNVIILDGSLMEYYLPIRVRHVLLTTQCISSIVCDANEFSYGNIYFVLPNEYLDSPLMTTDMVALASRANTAFDKVASMESKKKIRSRGNAWKGVRILPVAAEVSDYYESLNEDCVFSGGAEVPTAEILGACKTRNEDGNTEDNIQNLPAKREDFDHNDGEKLCHDEFEKLLEAMAERCKNQMKQNFYGRKRFIPILSTISEEYEV